MDSLTKGFCASVTSGSISSADRETWASLWSSPTLQVVDIQRYPKIIRLNEVSRFYLVVSDSVTLMWLIIPPGTDMEELVHTFQIEVGCCITLDDYTVVPAKNGLNVLVPRSLRYSGIAVALIGDPVLDPSLFKLSRDALTHRGEVFRPSGPGLPAGNHAVLSLREVVAACGEGLGDYEVRLRIIWKGRQRQLTSNTVITTRFVFDGVGVDCHGDAMELVFFGGNSLYETFDVGDCVRVANPTLAHRGDAAQLHLSDRSSVVTCAEPDSAIPRLPHTMQGARALDDVLERGRLGDVVTVSGIVESVRPVAVAHTRRGRVERATFTLRDGASTVDATLWDDLARAVRPVPGERWCLAGVALREFMRRATLSSRAGSAAFAMAPEPPRRDSDCDFDCEWGGGGRGGGSGGGLVRAALDLREASEALPVLAKVQRVELPLAISACATCGRRVRPPLSCGTCGGGGGAAVRRRALVRLALSDGAGVVRAVGFAPVGEVLFGLGEAEMLRRLAESPQEERRLAQSVVGLPLLWWLTRTPEGLVHVVNCKHVDMAECAAMLLESIEQMMK